MKNQLLAVVLLLLATQSFAQDAARELTVQLSAEINEDPNEITLNWLENTNPVPNTYLIWRKEKGASDWGSVLASLSDEELSYTDNTVEPGVSYEYQVQLRLGSIIYAWGYINSGIGVELPANRGDVLLLIDENFETSLATEIQTLQSDLYKDSWMVTTAYVNPENSPEDVKASIIDYYETLPNLNAVYLLGHIPVPYSGELYPDAHDNHIGAWPADVYYADIDGNWTDTDVNNTSAASARNHNIPGDGKFDQSTVPSTLELQISRVDFNDLDVFEETEEELLRSYLDKAHEFKTAVYIPTERGLIDQGSFTGVSEGFAQNGFRNFTAFFGPDNVDHIDYWTNLNSTDYLWSYGCGGGSYTGANGLDDGTTLTSEEIAAGFGQSSFTMLFGSYFGDWDVSNNFMRVALANGKTLSCSWAGRPNWHYHNMAMGENLGYAAKLSQDKDSQYLSLTLGDGTFVTGEGVHVAQLGDPSLRLYYLAPPGEVTAIPNVANTDLSWEASTDGSIEGYNIYRRSEGELWTKLNVSIVSGTSFTDIGLADAGTYEYMVKSVKLKTNASGTFYNESLGSIATADFFVSVESWKNGDFTFYPNPSNGTFTVQATDRIERLSILTIDGKVIWEEFPVSNKYYVNTELLSSGIYIISAEINATTIQRKLIVN